MSISSTMALGSVEDVVAEVIGEEPAAASTRARISGEVEQPGMRDRWRRRRSRRMAADGEAEAWSL
jgi:hypothetical protein